MLSVCASHWEGRPGGVALNNLIPSNVGFNLRGVVIQIPRVVDISLNMPFENAQTAEANTRIIPICKDVRGIKLF